MTHRQRILADRLIGVPAAFFFNALARILGRLLRRDHSITKENVRNIIVAKLIGMGSILQATPLLKALKRHFPHAKITFLTLRSNRELLERLTCVDEIITLDDRNVFAMAATTLRAIAAMISLRADWYFDLEVYSAFASLLALWAVTRNRIGFYRYSTAFKKGIYTHLVYFNTRMPVRYLYLQLGRVAGVPAGQTSLTGPVRMDDADRESIRRLLSESPAWRADKSYVVINPNASDLLLERRWPASHSIAAIEHLAALGHQVALMGAKNEQPYVQSLFDALSAQARSSVVNTAGRLTLGQLLALLEASACVLTNDTGPMHMSIALQRPTVCLFGPANPEHYGQNLPQVEIFYGRVFCSPCLYEADEPPCNGNNICMQRIEPEPVVEAVHRLSSSNSYTKLSQPSGRITSLPVIIDAPDGQPLGVMDRVSVGQHK
jgi:ADP-heptose:LPS heptosyltransferase